MTHSENVGHIDSLINSEHQRNPRRLIHRSSPLQGGAHHHQDVDPTRFGGLLGLLPGTNGAGPQRQGQVAGGHRGVLNTHRPLMAMADGPRAHSGQEADPLFHRAVAVLSKESSLVPNRVEPSNQLLCLFGGKQSKKI